MRCVLVGLWGVCEVCVGWVVGCVCEVCTLVGLCVLCEVCVGWVLCCV